MARSRLRTREHRVRRPEKAFAQPCAVIHVKEAVHGASDTTPGPIPQGLKPETCVSQL